MEWFNVHLVRDRDGEFGQRGVPVIEPAEWASRQDTSSVKTARVKRKTQRHIQLSECHVIRNSIAISGNSGRNGVRVLPSVEEEPGTEYEVVTELLLAYKDAREVNSTRKDVTHKAEGQLFLSSKLS